MRKLILILLLVLTGCGTTKYIPVESKVDSVYVEKVVERVDTIQIEIPVESKVVITPDKSHLETSVASSDAWVDSLSFLHHTLVNKAGNALKKEIVYKDKIIEKEVRVEVPIIQEVEKEVRYIPKWCWWLLGINIIIVIFIGVKLYLKIKI